MPASFSSLKLVGLCAAALVAWCQLASAQIVYNSLGCLTDSSSRILPNAGPQALQTLESCGAVAVSNFMPYFGLEFGGQCWYGSSLTTQVPSTNCNMPCTAKPSELCGGPNAINVYQVTPPPAVIPASSYVGCLTDSNSRILPQQGASEGASVESCRAQAVAALVPYFGLEFGGQCWFGSSIRNGTVSSSGCILACTAAPSERCGGAYAIDVYAMNASPAIIPYASYQGCRAHGVLSVTGPSGATAEQCAIFAAGQGARYFGLEAGGQCHYSWALNPNATATATSGCNLACTAAPNQRCGGIGAVDMWQFGF